MQAQMHPFFHNKRAFFFFLQKPHTYLSLSVCLDSRSMYLAMPDLKPKAAGNHSAWGYSRSKPAGNYGDYGESNPFWVPNNQSAAYGIEFKAKDHEEYDSSPPSPPLWRTSSPTASPTRPISSSSPYFHSSLCSRSQAIALGRREMMDMLKDMPESAYELSLRDLVEKRPIDGDRKESLIKERGSQKPDKIARKKGSKRHDLRSGSIDGGFLLKMFFPASFGSKKKKKSTGGSGRVSPVEKSVEGDWWRKKFSVGGEGDNSSKRSSSISSSNSSSRRSRQPHGLLKGCWSFSINKGKSHVDRA